MRFLMGEATLQEHGTTLRTECVLTREVAGVYLLKNKESEKKRESERESEKEREKERVCVCVLERESVTCP